jgi:hypothetical protein
MQELHKFLYACIPLCALAACGGGDTADRLDVADPVVRFVDVSQPAPNVTLYRGSVAQSDATNVAYGYASNYFDVGTGVADWSVQPAAGGAALGSVSIDPQRGSKYTVIALGTSASTSGVYLISDPYNKALTSDSTHLRLMNAAYNAPSVDLYMNTPGSDIAGVTPLIAATAFDTAGPPTGSDATDIPGGTYQVTITAAGTKTVLFKSQVSFAANKDLLLLTVPDPALGIKALLKEEGVVGTTALAPM